ncbi:MAG TPA: ABC transporter ATP-binding protein [Hyphomicrobiaceae bacterium]|nr:ABC transporter ATP-binding protein [Hyphomicrobiaceae bacterium]
MSVLEVKGLKKRREQVGSAFELRVPEFRLEAGRFYGVVGQSGSGKSTLLDMLALVMRPTSAERYMMADPRSGRSSDVSQLWAASDERALAEIRKTMCGYVLQSGGLIGFLTVRQNLEMPFQLIGRVPDTARIETMAERFGIGTQLDKKPRHLSGGQRQRVAILRALMLEPPLVLADEPTAAVDQVRARQIAAEFRSLAQEAQSTIVMVSHDRELLESVADRIIELSTEVGANEEAVSTARWSSFTRVLSPVS